MNLFDICIITTSSRKQADIFKTLINNRQKHGLYPREIDFKVYSDPPKGRIGSGGSTVLSLNKIWKEYRSKSPFAFFNNKKILIIHAGGESRRLPCYAPEGKLFAPLPVESSSIFPPVLLDIQLGLFFKYPWKSGEVLITSGDVIIDFDVHLLPDNRGDICGFAKPASLEQGSRHGVFVFDRDKRTVVDFLQKFPTAILAENAVLEGTGECALDIGLISLSPKVAFAFLDFSKKQYCNDKSILDALKNSQISFNLYLELMTACVKKLTFKEYNKRISSQTYLNKEILHSFFTQFHPFHLHALLTRSTIFVHLGSLNEFSQSCEIIHNRGMKPFYYQYNEEIKVKSSPSFIAYNSNSITTTSTTNQKRIIFENVKDCNIKNALGMNLLVGLRNWSNDIEIPEGFCIDERNFFGAQIRLIYSIYDTFKPEEKIDDIVFCNTSIKIWLSERGIEEKDIWKDTDVYDLIAARLFSTEFSHQFIEGFWKKPVSSQWTKTFINSKRFSIKEINEAEDVVKREEQRIDIRKEYLQDCYQRHIGWNNISIQDFRSTFQSSFFHDNLKNFYSKTDNAITRSYRRTLLSSVTDVYEKEIIEPDFGIEYDEIKVNTKSFKIGVKEDQIVWARSPVRIDLAGGWSDTPPHTLRLGGQVVNFAADLNGQLPIQVFCRRTKESHIRIHSIDLGVNETIKSFEVLEDYKNPGSPFALPKAALCLIGFTHKRFNVKTLEEILFELGCGLEITLLCAVPKGSGLGTSSILGATILAAIHRFFHLPYTQEELFWQVLKLEQMLTTGGGWQDQIGGIVGGIKYIESKPGYNPNFLIHKLDPYILIGKDTLECFTLFYTGITRLAKNILQDVVRQANENTPAYIFTLKYIKQLAVNAKDAISLRNMGMLAEVISQSWKANKYIHFSASNEEIERILYETRSYYTGVKLLGAGGGGYALFISKDVEQSKVLRKTLSKRFSNNKARLIDFSLNIEGLKVSVS